MVNRCGNSNRFYFLGLQNHCRRWLQPQIKRHLLPGRKAMTNLDSILKRRDITLPTNVWIVKPMVSPVVMYRCESWTIKKAEHWRTDVFELWSWRRLLRIPLTRKRLNQSILKEIDPEYSLQGLMLKLKLQSFSLLIGRANLSEKTLMLGKNWRQEEKGAGGEGSSRGWDGWMASLTQWTWVSANSRKQWKTGKPSMLQFMGLPRVRHDFSDWTTNIRRLF